MPSKPSSTQAKSVPFSRGLTTLEQEVVIDWEPQRGVNFILVNKRDGSVKRWQADAFFAFHHINAFKEQGNVVVDICALPDTRTINAFYLDKIRTGMPIPGAEFRRYRLPAGRTTADYEVIVNANSELPRLNYTQANGRDYRFAYGVSNRPDRPGDFHNQLVKVVDGGDQRSYLPDRARILKLDTAGALIAAFGAYGREPGAFIWPHTIAVDDAGSLYVGEVAMGMRVQKFQR